MSDKENNEFEIAEELGTTGLFCPEPLFEVRNLSGGMLNWHKKGYPTNKRNLNNPS